MEREERSRRHEFFHRRGEKESQSLAARLCRNETRRDEKGPATFNLRPGESNGAQEISSVPGQTEERDQRDIFNPCPCLDLSFPLFHFSKYRENQIFPSTDIMDAWRDNKRGILRNLRPDRIEI